MFNYEEVRAEEVTLSGVANGRTPTLQFASVPKHRTKWKYKNTLQCKKHNLKFSVNFTIFLEVKRKKYYYTR